MNTTVENNKLIAEFMGWDSNESKTVFYEPTDEVQGIDGFTLENLPFDNWNWLMEVVEKIENLHEANNVLIGTNLTYIQIHNKAINEQETFKGVGKAKIEAVYNAVVSFIEFYNSAQKEN